MSDDLDEEQLARFFGLIQGFPLPRGRERNTGICWKYTIHWGLRELLREIVQNLMDAIVGAVSSVAPGLTAEHINVECTNGTTDFEWTVVPGVGKSPVLLGSIKYDEDCRQLTLKNLGVIPMEGLLMGGGTKAGAKPDPNIAGRFGEGLKLAVLCALREGKSITIKTGGALWTFGLRWDPFFGQHCVYFLVDEDKSHDPTWTTIVIGGLTKEEWVSNPVENQGIHAFLTLRNHLGENLGAISSHTPGLGELLIGPHTRGCLFVKGIFVTRPMHGNYGYEFGYNFIELKLDRDRRTTQDQNQLIESTSSLIVNVLHNWETLAVRYSAASQIDTMVEMVYRGLPRNSWETEKVHSKWPLTGGKHPVCSKLLDMWRALNNIPEDRMPIADAAPLLQKRVQFGLSADFYEYEGVSYHQFYNFSKGARYETIEERMHRLAQEQVYEPGLGHPSFVDALSRWQNVEPGFPKASVRFTNLAYHQCYMLQNVIFLSRHLLDDAVVQAREGAGTNADKKIVAQLAVFRGVPVARLFGLFQI